MPADSVLIRRAVPSDLDTLVDLHAAFCDHDHHPFNADRARNAFAPLLDSDVHGAVWIIDSPGAYAVLTWGWSIEAGGAEALLDEIFVTAGGTGIGSHLIDHVLADGRQRGLARIVLETERHNTDVRAFYLRRGFRTDDSIWLNYEFVDLS